MLKSDPLKKDEAAASVKEASKPAEANVTSQQAPATSIAAAGEVVTAAANSVPAKESNSEVQVDSKAAVSAEPAADTPATQQQAALPVAKEADFQEEVSKYPLIMPIGR